MKLYIIRILLGKIICCIIIFNSSSLTCSRRRQSTAGFWHLTEQKWFSIDAMAWLGFLEEELQRS